MADNEMTREQYVNMSKIDSLARQNAKQAVLISELETQINLLNMELNELKEGAALAQPKLPGEEPVFEEVSNQH